MKNLENRKYGYRAVAVLSAIAMAGAIPITSFARNASKPGSAHAIVEPPAPDINKDLNSEFACSKDKQASLKDNALGLGELKDLVHEYNLTVHSNRSIYKDQKGKDLNTTYDDYTDGIDAIWNNADSDDDAAWATARFQAGVLQQQADDSYQDADMEKIQYDRIEVGLVYQAQQLTVTYEQSRYNMENLQSAGNLLKAQYEAAVTRQAAGVVTQADALSTSGSVQDQDTATLSAQKSADNVHRNLCLILGWAVDGQPEIRNVPEPDLNWIVPMNPEAGMKTAISNDYDVEYYGKRAGDPTSQYLIESNRAQLQDTRNKTAESPRNQCNTTLTNRGSLNTVVMTLDVAFVNPNMATVKRAVSEITELEYQSASNSYASARNSVKVDRLQPLLAMEAHDWNVKGLTASNQAG